MSLATHAEHLCFTSQQMVCGPWKQGGSYVVSQKGKGKREVTTAVLQILQNVKVRTLFTEHLAHTLQAGTMTDAWSTKWEIYHTHSNLFQWYITIVIREKEFTPMLKNFFIFNCLVVQLLCVNIKMFLLWSINYYNFLYAILNYESTRTNS